MMGWLDQQKRRLNMCKIIDVNKLSTCSEDWYAMCLSMDVKKIMRNFDVKYPSDVEPIVRNLKLEDFKTLSSSLKMLNNAVNFEIKNDLLVKWCKDNPIMLKYCLKLWKRLKQELL